VTCIDTFFSGMNSRKMELKPPFVNSDLASL